MSVNDRTTSVMNAMQEAKGYTGFAKGMQQFGAMAVPGVMTALTAQQQAKGLGMNPMNAINAIGQPNANNLNSITSAFGYNPDMDDEVDATNFGTPAMEMEAISQAMYGMSLTDMNEALGGIAPSMTYGYNPGDVDPGHGGTYGSSGQATSANGDVSYSSMNAFSNAMTAMGKSGYYGSKTQAQKDAKKGNKKALSYLTNLNAVEAKEQDDKDKAASTRGGMGSLGVSTNQFGGKSLGSGYGIGENTGVGSQGIGSETNDTSKGGTAPGTGPGTTATGMSTTDGGLGGGTGPGTTGPGGTATTGVDDAPGDNSSSESSGSQGDSSEHGGTYKGSLITKRKASGKLKKKYMKRGGLASRK